MNLELVELLKAMRQAYGRDLSIYDEDFLAKTLNKRLAAAGSRSVDGYRALLLADRAEAEGFIHSLQVTYSEFFRNSLTFALLEQLVLPALGRAREKTGQAELRIWSAGCAAGQEAYSIAILLDDLFAARPAPAAFRIFATDISAPSLAAGQAGTYRAAELDNVRLKQLRSAFTQAGEFYTVCPRLRERVDFSVYDLLDEQSASPPASIYGDFDLVICSNLLFYYQPGIRTFILDKIHRCLAPSGYLATGEAERGFVEQAGGFHPVASPGAVFQKTHRWK